MYQQLTIANEDKNMKQPMNKTRKKKREKRIWNTDYKIPHWTGGGLNE